MQATTITITAPKATVITITINDNADAEAWINANTITSHDKTYILSSEINAIDSKQLQAQVKQIMKTWKPDHGLYTRDNRKRVRGFVKPADTTITITAPEPTKPIDAADVWIEKHQEIDVYYDNDDKPIRGWTALKCSDVDMINDIDLYDAVLEKIKTWKRNKRLFSRKQLSSIDAYVRWPDNEYEPNGIYVAEWLDRHLKNRMNRKYILKSDVEEMYDTKLKPLVEQELRTPNWQELDDGFYLPVGMPL